MSEHAEQQHRRGLKIVVQLVGFAIGIGLLAGAVLLIRYGHVRFPYREDETRGGSGLPNFGKE